MKQLSFFDKILQLKKAVPKKLNSDRPIINAIHIIYENKNTIKLIYTDGHLITYFLHEVETDKIDFCYSISLEDVKIMEAVRKTDNGFYLDHPQIGNDGMTFPKLSFQYEHQKTFQHKTLRTLLPKNIKKSDKLINNVFTSDVLQRLLNTLTLKKADHVTFSLHQAAHNELVRVVVRNKYADEKEIIEFEGFLMSCND